MAVISHSFSASPGPLLTAQAGGPFSVGAQITHRPPSLSPWGSWVFLPGVGCAVDFPHPLQADGRLCSAGTWPGLCSSWASYPYLSF